MCSTITCNGPRLVRTKIPIVYELQCTSQPVSAMTRSRLVSTCTGARAWFKTNAHISPSSSDRSSRWWSSGYPGRRRPYWTLVGRVAHSSAIMHPQHLSRHARPKQASLSWPPHDASLQTIALWHVPAPNTTGHDLSCRRYPLSVSSTPLPRPASTHVHRTVHAV